VTITSTPSERSYAGNGVTTVFAIPFEFDTSSDITVLNTDSGGTVTELTSGFAITGGGGSTGTLTFTTAPASTVTITVLDDPAVTQPVDYTDNDAFPAEAHEGALDRIVRIIKRVSQKLDRTMRGPDGDPVTDFTLPSKSARLGKYLYFDAVTGEPVMATLLTTALTQTSFNAFLSTASSADALAHRYLTKALPAATYAQFYSEETIVDHAHYAFLDNSTITYAGGAPIYGHASFDSNVTFTGSVASDHHHAFQAYPHYGTAATIGRISGFYSIGELTAGTVTEWSHFRADDPTGSVGTITNQYGFYCATLAKASGNNYAFFSLGQIKSCLGGDLQLGSPATPATIRYEYTSGNLELEPRATYKVHSKSEYTLFGSSLEATCASLRNNPTTSDFEITARSGGKIVAESPTQVSHPLKLPSYTVVQLTGGTVAPASWTDCICICSNEVGGRTLVFSNGVNWKRVQDLANVS
jgi:hypothetical protein